MTPEITITRGLPASGKSHFAKQYVANRPNTYRLNLDDTRSMLGFGAGSELWSKEKEKVAVDLLISNLVQLVRQGSNVVVDNTHIHRDSMLRYKRALAQTEVLFSLADFTSVPLELCLERNAARTGPDRVPEEVIRKMAKTLQGQRGSGISGEWLNEGRWVKPEPYVAKPGTQKAVICDIDGTLALMDGRGPYEFWRVEEDEINAPVAECVRLYAAAGYAILITSGRDSKYREHTKRWLAKFHVFYDELFMRPEGDTRNDAVVKVELFNRHIRDKYNVVMSLDDRARVVQAWRELGLSTWAVAPGDF